LNKREIADIRARREVRLERMKQMERRVCVNAMGEVGKMGREGVR
jgi:hypothetical protein